MTIKLIGVNTVSSSKGHDVTNASNRTIAILGANGRLGRVVAAAFADAGWRVIAVTRSGAPVVGVDAEPRKADALKRKELIEACNGCGVIFNGLNPVYTKWRTQVMPLACNVIAAARSNGAMHLFPGNVYNYGSTIPAGVDADAPQVGDHSKARLRIEAENLFRRAAEKDDVKTLIIRAGDFFGGTGTGSWFDLFVAAKVAKGRVTYPGPMNVVHSWAYLPDLADAFVRLAESADELPDFDRFHFEGHSISGQEMKEAMERTAGRELKPSRFPWLFLRLGAWLVPMWREVNDISYLWDRPHRLDGAKLEQVAGPLRHTALDTAVASAMRDQGIALGAIRQGSRALPSFAA